MRRYPETPYPLTHGADLHCQALRQACVREQSRHLPACPRDRNETRCLAGHQCIQGISVFLPDRSAHPDRAMDQILDEEADSTPSRPRVPRAGLLRVFFFALIRGPDGQTHPNRWIFLYSRVNSNVDQRAERVHQSHLLDGFAFRLAQARGAEDQRQPLGARDRHVDPVDGEQEVHATRRFLGR